MGGSGPHTSVQTSPEICANPLRSVLYIGGGGGPMHVYCNVLLLTSNKKFVGPSLFFGLATPLGREDGAVCGLKLFSSYYPLAVHWN